MIIFLYGTDGYRLKENIDKIAAEYRRKYPSGLSLAVLDLTDDPAGQLAKLEDLVKTVSFFDEKRLVIIKNSFPAAEKIGELIKRWNLAEDQDRILTFIENASEKELAKKDRKYFGLLAGKPNISKTFEPFDVKELEKWANSEIKKLDLKITPEALQKLVSLIGGVKLGNVVENPNIIWRLKKEIEKIANYKSFDGDDNIKLADVELLVSKEADLSIFEVVDAFAARSKSKALLTLYEHLESGTDPYHIFSMLVYQFRNLLRIKSLAKNAVPYPEIIKKTNLSPFVIRKTYEQCKKFDLDELKQLFSKLAQVEIDAKNGEINMTDGLYKFVFSLT